MQALLDPLLALNRAASLRSIGRPEMELQPKVDPSAGGERAVPAHVSFGVPGVHPSEERAVQVSGLGLEMRGVAGPANQDAG